MMVDHDGPTQVTLRSVPYTPSPAETAYLSRIGSRLQGAEANGSDAETGAPGAVEARLAGRLAGTEQVVGGELVQPHEPIAAAAGGVGAQLLVGGQVAAQVGHRFAPVQRGLRQRQDTGGSHCLLDGRIRAVACGAPLSSRYLRMQAAADRTGLVRSRT